MRLAWLVALAWYPTAALAHGVGLDLNVGRVQLARAADESAAPPATIFVTTDLYGEVEAIENRLVVDAALSLLKDYGEALTWQAGLGLEYTPTDRWSLGLSGSYQPQVSNAYLGQRTMDLGTGPTEVDTTYRTRNTTGGLTLSGAFDTAGDSNLEAAFGLSVGWMRYAITEQLVYPLALRKAIADAGYNPAPEIVAALNQLRLGVSATVTLFLNTDLGLRFGWYGYDKSPIEAAYARASRYGDIAAALGVSTGLPVAPLRWDLRPAINHRFTRWFSATLQGGVGGYFDQGNTASVGLRLSFKPAKFLKLSVNASGQRDQDPPGSIAVWSWFVGLGTMWRF